MPEYSELFIILIFAIFTIATTSIGLECYNNNNKTKDNKPHNYIFLIVNLVCAILVILSVFTMIYVKI